MFLCLALFGISMHGTALGQEFCSEPVAPYCAETDVEFDTVLQVNRCEDDLKEYEQQLDEYEQCITQQLKDMRSNLANARTTLEQAKEEF